MQQYRTKYESVEADQFTGINNPFGIEIEVHLCNYRMCDLCGGDNQEHTIIKGTNIILAPKDWVVRFEDGRIVAYNDTAFQRLFEPVSAPSVPDALKELQELMEELPVDWVGTAGLGYDADKEANEWQRKWNKAFAAATSQLSVQPQSEGGLQWVKASKRVPKSKGWIVLKDHKKANGFYWFDGEKFLETELTEDSVWLDESVPQNLIQVEGRLRWIKGRYNELYRQVKSGIETPCLADYNWDLGDKTKIYRDICRVKPDHLDLTSRGVGYGSVKPYQWHDETLTEEQAFVMMCEHSNVEWIPVASPSTANTEEAKREQQTAIAFHRWMELESWEHEYREQRAFSIEELYELFLTETKQQ